MPCPTFCNKFYFEFYSSFIRVLFEIYWPARTREQAVSQSAGAATGAVSVAVVRMAVLPHHACGYLTRVCVCVQHVGPAGQPPCRPADGQTDRRAGWPVARLGPPAGRPAGRPAARPGGRRLCGSTARPPCWRVGRPADRKTVRCAGSALRFSSYGLSHYVGP